MKKILGVIFFLLFLGLIFFGINFLLNKVQINQIYCENQSGPCSSRLLTEIGKVKKGNVFEETAALNKMLSEDKSVSQYRVDFLLPFNLKVNAVEQKGVIAFKTADGNFALIDENGDVVDNVSKSDLFQVTSYTNLNSDERMYVAKLGEELYTFYGAHGGTITQDGMTVSGIDKKQIIFPLQGDIDVLLGSLNLIISRLPSVKEVSTISTIDLRFKNPVLR